MKKYEFTGKIIINFGVTLKQIKRLSDGLIGGYIEKESNLDHSGNAWVCGDARISGNARVYGDAQVYGNARVYGDAWVCRDAWVYGNAQVSGDARVSGNAWVSGNARVCGNAQVSGDASVFGKFELFNIVGFSFNITLTLTWAHVGCIEFNPMEIDDLEYDNRVSQDEFDAIKMILKTQYAFMLSKV